jgi:Mor family transcriptional regulator
MAKLKQKSQTTDRTKKILQDRKQGKSIVDLAKIYGLSRQRIFQIIKDYGDTLPDKMMQI